MEGLKETCITELKGEQGLCQCECVYMCARMRVCDMNENREGERGRESETVTLIQPSCSPDSPIPQPHPSEQGMQASMLKPQTLHSLRFRLLNQSLQLFQSKANSIPLRIRLRTLRPPQPLTFSQQFRSLWKRRFQDVGDRLIDNCGIPGSTDSLFITLRVDLQTNGCTIV